MNMVLLLKTVLQDTRGQKGPMSDSVLNPMDQMLCQKEKGTFKENGRC